MNAQPVMQFMRKNCPKICAAAAIGGSILTVVAAVKETPMAIQLLEQKKIEVGRPVLTKRETVGTVWKCYIPALGCWAFTTAMIITGNLVQAQQMGELAVAYSLSRTAVRLYSEQVAQEIGEAKAQQIREKVNLGVMHTVEPPKPGRLILLENQSDDPKDQVNLCFDYLSGRYFHASLNQINHAIDEFNDTVIKRDGRGSLNRLYFCFHNERELPPVGFADLLGWEYKDGQGANPMITYEADENGNPRMVLDFYNPPQYEF